MAWRRLYLTLTVEFLWPPPLPKQLAKFGTRHILSTCVCVCLCVCARACVWACFCGCGLRCPRATKVWSYQANDITKHFTKLITSSCRILTTSCEQIYVTSPALRLQCYIVAYMLHICSSILKYCTYGFLDTKLWK